MGWRDAPVIEKSSAKWEGAPVVEDDKPKRDKFDLRMDDDAYDSSEYEAPNERPLLRLKEARKENRAPAVALGDAALGMAAGGVGQIVGGLGGLGKAAYALAKGDGIDSALKQGADTVNSVTGAMYQPKTAAGQNITAAVGMPFEMGGKALGAIGEAAGDVVGPKTAAAGRTLGENALPAAAAIGGGVAAFKARPGSAVNQAADAAKQAAERAETVSRAEAKANASGLEWAKLPVEARKQIVALAQDATEFDKMSPEMIQRAAMLKGLPVPIKGTKGQLSRDPVQIRTEKNLSQTDAGSALEDRYVEQNKGLLDNLDTLANKGSAKAKSATEVGRQVAEKALGKKADEAKAKVNDLYRQANKSAESEAAVSPYPLIDYVHDHPNAAAVGWITDRLKKNQIITGTDDLGQPMISRDITLREVSELRKVAERVGKSGAEGSGWAPEVKAVLDKMIDGKGGEKYAAARDAYKAYKGEFDNQQAVRQLIETKGGKYSTDRRVALEDVFDKSVVNGSVQDLKNLRQSLLEAENKGTRKQGRKALNELAAQTVKYIRDESTKGITDRTGAPEVSAPALKRAVEKIGDEKLDLLLGKTTADQLRNVVQAAQDLKTSPPKRIAGSDTGVNILTMLDKVFSKLPVGSTIAKGVVKLVKNANEAGKADLMTDQALLEEELKPKRLRDQTELRAFLPGAAAAAVSEQARP